MNAVEREPVPTRVLNPNASEASYKPKQRSCRKTKLNFFFFFFRGDFDRGDFVGGILSWNHSELWWLEIHEFQGNLKKLCNLGICNRHNSEYIELRGSIMEVKVA